MDLSQVTLTQMRYALAVADARSFRVAAENCNVSQSGLSMQLAKLEELLEVSLFDRSRKPILVTDAGRRALEQMASIIRETERLGQIVSEEDEPSGPFRLGVIPTLSSSVVPLFLAEFVSEYPKVELTLEELKTDEIVARLNADKLDAGILATPLHEPGIKETPLALEAFFAYLPPGDPLLKKQKVSQIELQARQLWVMPEGHCFRTQVLSYCRGGQAGRGGLGGNRGLDGNSGVSSPVHFESGSFQTLISLVDDGMGATVLPALVARRLPASKRKAQLRPLTGPSPVREIGLVRSRKDLRSRVNEALVQIIKHRLHDVLEPAPKKAEVIDPIESKSLSDQRTRMGGIGTWQV